MAGVGACWGRTVPRARKKSCQGRDCSSYRTRGIWCNVSATSFAPRFHGRSCRDHDAPSTHSPVNFCPHFESRILARERTRMLSLIMLFVYVFSSTSSLVRSCSFFTATSSTHRASTAAATSLNGGSSGPPRLAAVACESSYAACSVPSSAGSRPLRMCRAASVAACGARGGQTPMTWIRRSTAVRPLGKI